MFSLYLCICFFFFFSSRRRHTRLQGDWSSDVCSSDLSNMQRQSVPLLFPQAPLVGTGLEEKVARDSGAVVIARRGGVVTRVTADEIIIDSGDEEAADDGAHPLARLKQDERVRLQKFWRGSA